MNLNRLFQMQKVLRDRIGYNEPDRLEKLILALLVEIGECSNEWRGFKFWSKRQFPRIKATRFPTMMEEDKEYYNPLLEEFVDGLHFILELGIELDLTHLEIKKTTLNDSTTTLFIIASDFTVSLLAPTHPKEFGYKALFGVYLQLGERLGFTWEEIEQAYISKNEINHVRQDIGY